MFKTETEIWEAVKQLKGQTIYTLSHRKPNQIIEVDDTGNLWDEIHILDRHTKPTREDVLEAYKTLVENKELERKRDLAHLSGVNKQKSAIVFALVYYIAKERAELITRDRRVVIILKS